MTKEKAFLHIWDGYNIFIDKLMMMIEAMNARQCNPDLTALLLVVSLGERCDVNNDRNEDRTSCQRD